MSLPQFIQVRAAAEEILRLHKECIEIAPATVKWASDFIRFNKKPPHRPSINQDKVRTCLADAPLEGLTAIAIAEATGIDQRILSVTLCYMVKTEAIAMLKIPGRSRYFINVEMLRLGKPLVRAEESRRRIERRNKNRKPLQENTMPAAPKKNRATNQKPPALAKPEASPKRSHRSQKPPEGEATTPPHVKVQVCPSGVDTRYMPSHGSDGAGFMSEWRARRAK